MTATPRTIEMIVIEGRMVAAEMIAKVRVIFAAKPESTNNV